MNIQVNQLGYTPAMQKTALLRGDLGSDLLVKNAAGETVLTLPVSSQRTLLWEDDLATVDFSALQTPGTYTLHCGSESSYPFSIAEIPTPNASPRWWICSISSAAATT